MGIIISSPSVQLRTPHINAINRNNTTENRQPERTDNRSLTYQQQLDCLIEWSQRAPINEPRYRIVDLIIDIISKEWNSGQSRVPECTLDLSMYNNLTSLPEILPDSVTHLKISGHLKNIDLRLHDRITALTIGESCCRATTINELLLPHNLKSLKAYSSYIKHSNISSLSKLESVYFSEIRNISGRLLPQSITKLWINNSELQNESVDNSSGILSDFSHLINLNSAFLCACNFNEVIIPKYDGKLSIMSCRALKKIAVSELPPASSVGTFNFSIDACEQIETIVMPDIGSILSMSMKILKSNPDVDLSYDSDIFSRI